MLIQYCSALKPSFRTAKIGAKKLGFQPGMKKTRVQVFNAYSEESSVSLLSFPALPKVQIVKRP